MKNPRTPNLATATTTSPAAGAAAAADAEAPLADIAAWDDERTYQMICETAYYRAERRGFAPGDELADWLAAEQEVRALLARPSR